eukprot:TRINITY_DN6049_c0_g4_i1.p1 TRINITY_DN6049_c0_g4~~TRINITY_DN6049_c0_g4_i1.p1  ORF type:complete len:421 (-),score=18.87 TRINITY_DN6049_c0_g4_i1:1773-2999(-)
MAFANLMHADKQQLLCSHCFKKEGWPSSERFKLRLLSTEFKQICDLQIDLINPRNEPELGSAQLPDTLKNIKIADFTSLRNPYEIQNLQNLEEVRYRIMPNPLRLPQHQIKLVLAQNSNYRRALFTFNQSEGALKYVSHIVIQHSLTWSSNRTLLRFLFNAKTIRLSLNLVVERRREIDELLSQRNRFDQLSLVVAEDAWDTAGTMTQLCEGFGKKLKQVRIITSRKNFDVFFNQMDFDLMREYEVMMSGELPFISFLIENEYYNIGTLYINQRPSPGSMIQLKHTLLNLKQLTGIEIRSMQMLFVDLVPQCMHWLGEVKHLQMHAYSIQDFSFLVPVKNLQSIDLVVVNWEIVEANLEVFYGFQKLKKIRILRRWNATQVDSSEKIRNLTKSLYDNIRTLRTVLMER